MKIKTKIFLSVVIISLVSMVYVYKNLYELGLWPYKQKVFNYMQEVVLKVPFVENILESDSYSKKVNQHNTAPEDVLKFYQSLKDLHEIFEAAGLDYWLEGGTLLGAIRHKGIIPWDDDVDVTIHQKDKNRFESLIPIFEDLGYKVIKMYLGFQIYKKQEKGQTPYMDVFLMEDDGTDLFYSSPEVYKSWPQRFSLNMIYPTKLISFGSFQVRIPNKPKIILDAFYGTSWGKIAYEGTDHLANVQDNYKKFKLNKNDFKPAQPLGPLKDNINQVLLKKIQAITLKNSL